MQQPSLIYLSAIKNLSSWTQNFTDELDIIELKDVILFHRATDAPPLHEPVAPRETRHR